MKMYVIYSDEQIIISNTYGYDGQYTGHRYVECNFIVKGISKNRPENPYYVEVKTTSKIATGSIVYVVIARYCDGGTFSTTHGLGQIINVFANHNDAKILKQQILDGLYTGHKEWGHYFSKLEGVDIESLLFNE